MKTKIVHISLLILFVSSSVLGQDNLSSALSWSTKFQIGYSIGGQIYNDNFIYNPGFTIQLSMVNKVNKHVDMGLGTGYSEFKYERFVPIYFEAVGYRKNKSTSPFIRFQAGYSAGWNNNDRGMVDYNLKGGYYFNAGFGRKFKISEKYALLFQWSYCIQFAELNYEIFGEKKYVQNINYEMIQISVGFIIY